MGYFRDSRRNWAGAFWAATAIPLVLDPWNPIWDESGWLEEQFGAPYASLGPSGRNDYFTPNFWAGRSSETVGRRGPRTSPKVSPIMRAPVVPKAQIWSSKKICFGPPPPPLSVRDALLHPSQISWTELFDHAYYIIDYLSIKISK